MLTHNMLAFEAENARLWALLESSDQNAIKNDQAFQNALLEQRKEAQVYRESVESSLLALRAASTAAGTDREARLENELALARTLA